MGLVGLVSKVDEEGGMHQLTVRDVACEPPEVAWEHLGLDVRSISCRAAVASVAVLVSASHGLVLTASRLLKRGFCLIAAAVVLPLATYNISYVSQAIEFFTGSAFLRLAAYLLE